MWSPGLPAKPITLTPTPGKTQPGGVREQRHVTHQQVRAVMMLEGEYPGEAGRRRAGGGEKASPWASCQRVPGALHGSMTTVSGPSPSDKTRFNE